MILSYLWRSHLCIYETKEIPWYRSSFSPWSLFGPACIYCRLPHRCLDLRDYLDCDVYILIKQSYKNPANPLYTKQEIILHGPVTGKRTRKTFQQSAATNHYSGIVFTVPYFPNARSDSKRSTKNALSTPWADAPWEKTKSLADVHSWIFHAFCCLVSNHVSIRCQLGTLWAKSRLRTLRCFMLRITSLVYWYINLLLYQR